MATPAYRIYYGKYPDQLTNEIPNDHIKSVDGLQFRIEPGKPAEPKVDEVTFTLENLNVDETERYDDGWFNAESRSQHGGASFPNQLFFKIELDTGVYFLGVVGGKSYSQWRATVEITVKSLLSLVSDGSLTMLVSIPVSDVNVVFIDGCGSSQNAFPCCRDLDGNDFDQQKMELRTDFNVYEQGKDPGFENTALLQYLFGETSFQEPIEDQPSTYTILDTGPINLYVKINEITILTTVQIKLWKIADPGYTKPLQNYIEIYVWHADIAKIETNGQTILPRGRFFADDEGTYIQENDLNLDFTLIGPDRGHSPEVMIKQSDMPTGQMMFGCPVQEENGRLQIQGSENNVDVFSLFSTTLNALEDNLFSDYYQGPVNLFDLSNTPANVYRNAFYADLSMFGWLNQSLGDVLVNLSMMLNCYVFYNGSGQIVLQHRLIDGSLPETLPPGAFEVDLADIRPLGSQDEGNGFDSFEIEYSDRIEINNVEAEEPITQFVDGNGVRQAPALRNTDIEVQSYRTSSLAVPATDNGLPLFRRSPDDPNFGVSGTSLARYVPTAVAQAQNFAASWTYPVTLWKIQWDMPKYPQAGIGTYFWVQWPTEKRVYLIRDITHDPDQLLHKMEVQKLGVWNG